MEQVLLTNELYFGTNPSSLNLVQSGTLATSWTITGYTFTYGTTYYWQVIEIGDTCDTNGPIWNFTTVQDPNLVIDTMKIYPGMELTGRELQLALQKPIQVKYRT